MRIYEEVPDALEFLRSNIIDPLPTLDERQLYSVGDEVIKGNDVLLCVRQVDNEAPNFVRDSCSASSIGVVYDAFSLLRLSANPTTVGYQYTCGDHDIQTFVESITDHGAYKGYRIRKTIIRNGIAEDPEIYALDVYPSPKECPAGKNYIQDNIVYRKSREFGRRSEFEVLRPILPLMLIDKESNTMVSGDGIHVSFAIKKDVRFFTLSRLQTERVNVWIKDRAGASTNHYTTQYVPESHIINEPITEIIEIPDNITTLDKVLEIRLDGKSSLVGITANNPPEAFNMLEKDYKMQPIDLGSIEIDEFGRREPRTRPIIRKINCVFPVSGIEETSKMTLFFMNNVNKYMTIDPFHYYTGNTKGLLSDVCRAELVTGIRKLYYEDGLFEGDSSHAVEFREVL